MTFAARLRRGVIEAALLLLVGAAATTALQLGRSDPLPLELPSGVWNLDSGATWIGAARARDLFRVGDALFVDVRPARRYEAGHVPGAPNVEPDRFYELREAFLPWAEGLPIVVYGSRADLPAVDEVLRLLADAGHPDLLAFPAGWEGWMDAGGPEESGPDPLLSPDAFDSFDEPDDGESSDEGAEDTE